MASPHFCPATPHHLLPTRARAPPCAAAAADPGKKPPSSPSDAPLVHRVVIPSGQPKSRPWWTPLLLSAVRRPGSDRAPATDRSGDAEEEIGAGRPGKGGRPFERKRSALTAEKARVLRREMRATETWHDAMYHSAIASRLASPDEH